MKTVKPFAIVLFLIGSLQLMAQDASWFSKISVTPSEIKVGQKVQVKVTLRPGITNQKQIVIKGGIDENEITRKVFSLSAKMGPQLISFDWVAIDVGDHNAYFEIEIKEGPSKKTSSRQSMKVTKSFKVNSDLVVANISKPVQRITAIQPECDTKPLPDIVVSGVAIGGYEPPGSILSTSINLINTGQCETGTFMLRVKYRTHDGGTIESEWKYYTVSSIPPERGNGEGDYSISYPIQTIAKANAEYDFIVEADYDNNVNEFIESNNKIDRGGRFSLKTN